MADENTPAQTPESAPIAESQTETPAVETETPATETPESASETRAPEWSEEGKRSKAKTDAFQTRIDHITKARREAERENAELKIRLAAYEAKKLESVPETKTPENVPFDQKEIERLVEQKAQEKLVNQQYQGRVNDWLRKGNSEFKDFTDRCNTVANLGAGERPDFLQVITDPTIIPDGHKLVAALADDPAEAARILALPSIAMSAELVRMSERMDKPKGKAISSAPPPIKPIDGTARGSDEPSPDDSEDEWFRKREAQVAQKRTGARF